MALKTGFTKRNKGKEVFAAESVTVCGNTGGNKTTVGAIMRASGGVVGAGYFSATGTGNGADTTEDTLWTYSLPANAFDAVAGDMVNFRGIYVYAWGVFANNAHSKHARLYFGSEVVDSGANTTTGGIGWALELLMFHAASNVQVGSGQSASSTTPSRLSAASRTFSIAGSTVPPKCLASASASLAP